MLAAGSAPMLFNGCSTGFLACRKINIGVVGFGRIAHSMDVPLTIKYTDRCRFTAVCDLDAKRRAYGAKFIRDWYAKNAGETAEVREYADYHAMFADPSIDAVMLCVPDHWHAILATDAILAGKHIWLQKPFTQTIEEGRILADLAKKYNRVVQVGSWQRSVRQFALVCELVRNGRIGDVRKVEVGIGCDREGGIAAAAFLVGMRPGLYDMNSIVSESAAEACTV
jgi:predicted dehydrogenase